MAYQFYPGFKIQTARCGIASVEVCVGLFAEQDREAGIANFFLCCRLDVKGLMAEDGAEFRHDGWELDEARVMTDAELADDADCPFRLSNAAIKASPYWETIIAKAQAVFRLEDWSDAVADGEIE